MTKQDAPRVLAGSLMTKQHDQKGPDPSSMTQQND